MTHSIAFLRAINVGGHTVKMEALRQLFAALGFSNVETFINSGNVIFETRARKTSGLEKKIEAHLRQALGYAVVTCLRSTAELAAIAAYQPFPAADPSDTLYVAFTQTPPGPAAQAKLLAAQTASDHFHVQAREIYWLIGTRFSDSPFSGSGHFEKLLGAPATVRNTTTVRKLAAKYPVAA